MGADVYMSLQESEGIVVQAAATIYGSYVAAGVVDNSNRSEIMKESVSAAIQIARLTDKHINSDDESRTR